MFNFSAPVNSPWKFVFLFYFILSGVWIISDFLLANKSFVWATTSRRKTPGGSDHAASVLGQYRRCRPGSEPRPSFFSFLFLFLNRGAHYTQKKMHGIKSRNIRVRQPLRASLDAFCNIVSTCPIPKGRFRRSSCLWTSVGFHCLQCTPSYAEDHHRSHWDCFFSLQSSMKLAMRRHQLGDYFIPAPLYPVQNLNPPLERPQHLSCLWCLPFIICTREVSVSIIEFYKDPADAS